MTETRRKRTRNPGTWPALTNPYVGELIRIKTISGTNHASKRSPIWALVEEVYDRPEINTVHLKVVMIASSNPAAMKWMLERRKYSAQMWIDAVYCMPAPKRVPEEVAVNAIRFKLAKAV